MYIELTTVTALTRALTLTKPTSRAEAAQAYPYLLSLHSQLLQSLRCALPQHRKHPTTLLSSATCTRKQPSSLPSHSPPFMPPRHHPLRSRAVYSFARTSHAFTSAFFAHPPHAHFPASHGHSPSLPPQLHAVFLPPSTSCKLA